MKPYSFITKARSYLSTILSERGEILYSEFSTMTSGNFYILGLNPGGPINSGDTIAQRLNDLPKKKNAYLDEDWSSANRHYDPGCHPLQRHLQLLMKELGQQLRCVCASNLIFTRSPNQYGSAYPGQADLCWPVHEMVLEIVRPNVIITFGNGSISPYKFLALKHDKATGKSPRECTCLAENGKWLCKAFKTELCNHHLSSLIIGLPHLSRYTIERRPKVVNWIKDNIQKHNISISG